MCSFSNLLLVMFMIAPFSSTLFISPHSNSNESQISKSAILRRPFSNKNLVDEDLTLNYAQESATFFTSDLGTPFDSSSDYGALFDNFPSLPYFPEFGEIFRISHTTTPEPPFTFPDFVRDAFPNRHQENNAKPSSSGDTSNKYRNTVSGGRRPARRPPRPASSGTRTKVSKQNQTGQRERPKIIKNKSPTKSKEYPKIFKFTSDRVNLADFDMMKKMNENYLTLAKGDDLDSDKVKRNKFLILHGGIFEIDRNRRHGLYASNSNVHPDLTFPGDSIKYQ